MSIGAPELVTQNRVRTCFRWRPQLRDPADEMMLPPRSC